jgi:hypothetical protein
VRQELWLGRGATAGDWLAGAFYQGIPSSDELLLYSPVP